jgi:hypothetical protein
MFRRSILAALLLAASGNAHAQTIAPAELAALCNQRNPCSLAEAKSAGSDAAGRALTVIELSLGEANPDNPNFRCRPYRREIWLKAAGLPPRRIMELCNDGYGAAGVGEDELTVKQNLLEHAQNGGSAWRWDVTRRIQLSPLRVLEEAHCSYHNLAPGFTSTRWDWQRFAGETRWTPKRCALARTKAEEEEELGCTPEKAARRYIPIPLLEGALERGGGKRLHLGSCASAIDEGGERGFLLYGTPRSGGAELRVLLISRRDLVVTVSDERFATGAASWVHDDHIELWLGHGRTNLECEDEKPTNLRQWGISLDGKVHAGHGNPRTAPRVVARLEGRVGRRSHVTLHLFLPEEADGLTLAYSKSANGKQARLVATSRIQRTDATTLGAIWRVGAKGARCIEKDGQLDLAETGSPALLRE